MKFRKSLLIRCFLLSILAMALLSMNALAQNQYPNKPIKLLVPFPPGGSTDIFARMLGDAFTQMWGQPVIIENKPGASGQIAVDMLMKAPADGYTLFMGHIGTLAVSPALYPNLSYDPIKDFDAVSRIALVPNVLAVNNSRPFKTVNELVEYAKKNPGKLSYSSGGNGSAAHIATEYLKLLTGTNMMHVPYKGTAPAIVDLIGGQVDFIITGAPPLMQHIEAGNVRALGVTSTKRIDALPKLPTISESGIPELKNFEATQWYGLVVKKGTPRDIVMKLNQGIRTAFDNPQARAKLKQDGSIVQVDTPEAFTAFINSEMNRWGRVVNEAKIKPD